MSSGNGTRRTLCRAVAAAALLVLPVTTGCFGKFNVTRNMVHFNERVSPNKWVRWGVFVAFNVVPVYEISVLMDTLVFNAIEFWTGRNPARDIVVRGPRGSVGHLSPQPDGSMFVDIETRDGMRHVYRLEQRAEGVVALEVRTP